MPGLEVGKPRGRHSSASEPVPDNGRIRVQFEFGHAATGGRVTSLNYTATCSRPWHGHGMGTAPAPLTARFREAGQRSDRGMVELVMWAPTLIIGDQSIGRCDRFVRRQEVKHAKWQRTSKRWQAANKNVRLSQHSSQGANRPGAPTELSGNTAEGTPYGQCFGIRISPCLSFVTSTKLLLHLSQTGINRWNDRHTRCSRLLRPSRLRSPR